MLEVTAPADLLHQHMLNTKWRGVAERFNGKARVMDEERGWVCVVSVRIMKAHVLAARFRALGDPRLQGVASFVMECVNDVNLETIAILSPPAICQALGLELGDPMVQIVLVTLARCLGDWYERFGSHLGVFAGMDGWGG